MNPNFKNIKRINKLELDELSLTLAFLKNVLIDMSNNLLHLNKLKLYDNLINGYNTLYNELKYIKDKFDIMSDNKKNLDSNSFSRAVYDIQVLLLLYVNHIAPSLDSTIKLILGHEWYTYFNPDDVDKIKLLMEIFTPINVWDSSYHLIPLQYKDLLIPPRTPISKDTINSMIESKTDNLSSLIVGNTVSFTNFIKSLTNIIVKDKKITKLERKKDFNYSELNDLFNNKVTNTNIVLYKNTISSSFIEEKLGFNILLKINTRIILIQGLVKDDLLELYKSQETIIKRYTYFYRNMNHIKYINHNNSNYNIFIPYIRYTIPIMIYYIILNLFS